MIAPTMEKKTASVFPATFPGAPVIYLNTYSNEGRRYIRDCTGGWLSHLSLVTISNLDWNHDMAPWNSPAAFKNGEPFTGGADDYLRLLVEEIIPGQKRLGQSSGMAGSLVLAGRAIRSVRHPSDGCVLQGRVHVRFSVVSWFQGVHFLPRAEAPTECIYFSG